MSKGYTAKKAGRLKTSHFHNAPSLPNISALGLKAEGFDSRDRRLSGPLSAIPFFRLEMPIDRSAFISLLGQERHVFQAFTIHIDMQCFVCPIERFLRVPFGVSAIFDTEICSQG